MVEKALNSGFTISRPGAGAEAGEQDMHETMGAHRITSSLGHRKACLPSRDSLSVIHPRSPSLLPASILWSPCQTLSGPLPLLHRASNSNCYSRIIHVLLGHCVFH